MQSLEKRIAEDGQIIGDDILKVDMFLNHQIDVGLLNDIGREFRRVFDSAHPDKILTIEASGIGIACITAQYFGNIPVVFAKKGAHRNVGSNLYCSDVFSYTKGVTCTIGVSKNYLHAGEKVLIIDDFLAKGGAVLGLKEIVEQAGAELCGVGIVVEKGFQDGGAKLRAMGINVQSLAVVQSMKDGKITFVNGSC